jgi:hypothetical protein
MERSRHGRLPGGGVVDQRRRRRDLTRLCFFPSSGAVYEPVRVPARDALQHTNSTVIGFLGQSCDVLLGMYVAPRAPSSD